MGLKRHVTRSIHLMAITRRYIAWLWAIEQSANELINEEVGFLFYVSSESYITLWEIIYMKYYVRKKFLFPNKIIITINKFVLRFNRQITLSSQLSDQGIIEGSEIFSPLFRRHMIYWKEMFPAFRCIASFLRAAVFVALPPRAGKYLVRVSFRSGPE